MEDILELHGGRWNGPEHCGLLVLEAIGVAGVPDCRHRMGAWMAVQAHTKTDEALWLQMEIADLRHDLAPGESLASPPVFLALTKGSADDAFALAQKYLKASRFSKAASGFAVGRLRHLGYRIPGSGTGAFGRDGVRRRPGYRTVLHRCLLVQRLIEKGKRRLGMRTWKLHRRSRKISARACSFLKQSSRKGYEIRAVGGTEHRRQPSDARSDSAALGCANGRQSTRC